MAASTKETVRLTNREREVVGLLAEGLSNKEIGNRVQPGEPGVLLEQFDQHLDGFHGSTHAFIRLLLGKDEGTVKPDEAFPDRQHCSTPWIHGNQRRRVRGRSHMSSVAGLYESASGLDADIKTDAFVS